MNTMKNNMTFEDIRPYFDEEIPSAMNRIANDNFFPILASYVFPDAPLETVRQQIKSINSIRSFQSAIMTEMNKQIIDKTMTNFTYSGLENIDSKKSYLFIANHRDIVMDSSLMQYVLFTNGLETSEITFGANLMQNQLIIDIGKSNKMFKVERPSSNIKEFYKSSLKLSEYIRYTICEKEHSVWIAQRNGRTKDGMDLTDQGIIKMFGMSNKTDQVQALADLNILPVSISYEWEPCDILKALELYQKKDGQAYAKKPGEDITSILTGMTQFKGRVHLEFCKPLKYDEINDCLIHNSCDFNKLVASLIDSRIQSSYCLYPNNYIAYDMLHQTCIYSHFYSRKEYLDFVRHLKELNKYSEDLEMDILLDIFLRIYANPLNYQKND